MFKFLFKIIKFAILVILSIIGLAFTYNKGWLKIDPLKFIGLSSTELWSSNANSSNNEKTNTTFDIKNIDLQNLGEDGLKQVKILSEKALNAGQYTQSFLQEAVQVDTNSEKSLTDKAFEFGRYTYCKQVVKTYEASHSQQLSF